jgi:tetratricopeptide (TPR) repeat protein
VADAGENAPPFAPPAPGSSEGATAPRFDLRFEAGRGLLTLAKPLAAGPFRLVDLELGLGRVAFPLDVSGGASAFRHRRTILRRARFRADPRDLCRLASERGGVRFSASTPDPGVIELGVRDDFGALAARLHLLVDAGDLVAWPADVRCAVEGPSTAVRRLAEALASVGAEIDPAAGVFRLADPARRLLAETLVAGGYRLPAIEHAALARPRIEDGEAWVELGVDGGGDAEQDLDVLERARLCASVLRELAADDPRAAHDALVGLDAHVGARSNAGPGLSEAVARWGLVCGIEQLAPAPDLDERATALGEDPLALSVRLRLHLRSGALPEAAALAERLASVEPVADLATDALASVARAISSGDPARAHALLVRASERRPDDADVAVLRVELAERARDVSSLLSTARRALSGAYALEDRARVASAAALSLERMSRTDDAELLFREALHAAPDDPVALEGLAGLYARRGERAEAVVRLDRAARARERLGDVERAAAIVRRAAELLVGAGRLSAAEARLERAIALFDKKPELHCALARLRSQMGAHDASTTAWEGLLALEGRGVAGLEHALVEAAAFHLDERDDAEGAAPFVESLRRIAPADVRLSVLEDRLGLAGVVREPDLPDPLVRPERRSQPAPSIFEEGPRHDAAAFEPTEQVELPDDDPARGEPETDGLDEIGVAAGGDEWPSSRDPGDGRRERAAPPPEAEAGDEDAAALRHRADRLREAGDHAGAAMALAEAGVRARDAATLRAALALAERVGARREALRIIDMALAVVGSGPARDELLRRRERLDVLGP